MSPRHAYREPAPRLHLRAAVADPAAPVGHRITLIADDTPRVPRLVHGPADLSLVWELPVLAVQAAPGAPVRVVARTRYEILTSHLRRINTAVVRVHDRSGAMLRANDAHMDLLLRKSELLAWRWLPKLTKISGQVRGHALAAAYAEGGTDAYLGLVSEVRAMMWNDAVAGAR